MHNAVVYWIRLENHTNVLQEGYVGVARNLEKRISRHRRLALLGKHQNTQLQDVLSSNAYTVDILFSGDEAECYIKEFELRSYYRIGWNIVPGGNGGSTTLGMKMSEEFKKKVSDRMIGNTISKGNHKQKSEEHRKKISAANKGKPKSEEHKKKQSDSMKGRKQSIESNEKRRNASLGKKRGPYKKKENNVAI
jgi:hypothetical protein